MTVYLIRGLPGSGKSTYAKSLGFLHIEADMYFVRDGAYAYNAVERQAAHAFCRRVFLAALAVGCDVAVSNTFTQRWELDFYMKQAVASGAELKIITMRGEFGNVHGVPEDVISKMRERWEE